MLRLMFRLGLISFIIAPALILAAFGVGALLDVPTLVFRAGSGYAFFDPARGVIFWRDLGLERDFTPMAFDQDYRLRANLLSRTTFITTITIQDVDAGTVLCEVDPGFPLNLASYDWDREAGLNFYGSRGLYHLDVPTCTLRELVQVEQVISQTSWIDPYVAFIAGEGGHRHAFLWDQTTDELRQISETSLGSENPYLYWHYQETAPDVWEPDLRYLLFGDQDEFHLYNVATGPLQSIDEVEGQIVWDEDYLYNSDWSFSIDPHRFPAVVYRVENGQIGEPIFYEPDAYSTQGNFYPISWSLDQRSFVYVAVDPDAGALTPETPTRLYLFDPEEQRITHLLPELDRVEQAYFLPNGQILVNQRVQLSRDTLIYDPTADRQYSMNSRLSSNPLAWSSDYQNMYYVDPSLRLVRHDLNTQEEETIVTFGMNQRVLWGFQSGDYLALVTSSVASSTQGCLRFVHLQQRTQRELVCAANNTLIDFHWIEDDQ
jgi:hypothetical protein